MPHPTMIIGVLQFEISIDGASSLKDKRRVVNSIKDRLHREHQVSVAEVGNPEVFTVATLGLTMASSDARYCRSVLDKITGKLQRGRDFVLTDHRIELIQGQ